MQLPTEDKHRVQHLPNDAAAEMPTRARLALRPVAFDSGLVAHMFAPLRTNAEVWETFFE
jgi:hypothetical protein